MNSKILYVNEGITLANQFVLCMFFFIVAQTLLLGAPVPWYYQILFLIFLLFTVAIRLLITSTFIIYLGLHIVLLVSVYMIPMNNLLRLESTLYLIILTCQSVDFWKRNGYKQNSSLPWPSLLAMLCFYIYGIATHREQLCSIINVIGSVYLLLYLVKLYVTGLYELVNSKTNVSRLPLTQIVKTNSLIIGVILFVITIAVLLANIFNMDQALFTIGKCLLIVFHYIYAGIGAFLSWLYHLLFKGNPSPGQAPEPLREIFANLKPNASLLGTILEILFYIFQCLVLGIIVFWIFRGAYRLVKRFLTGNMQSGDIVEGLSCQKKDDLVFVTEQIRGLPFKLPLSKIRRKYKRAVLKHKKEIDLKPSLTTDEIAALLSEKEREQMQKLKASYEAVRYYKNEGEK